MELFHASKQWAERPDDERFGSLEELHRFCDEVRTAAATSTVPANQLKAIAVGPELMLNGRTETTARLSHWAFGQLCGLVGAPGAYLATLPAELAAQNLQHGMSHVRDESPMRLLFHRDDQRVLCPGRKDGLLARAITSDRYTRIWNVDVTTRLQRLGEDGWRVPPARPAREGQRGTRPATEADVIRSGKAGLSVNVGDLIAPAGLYAGDRDMFAFLINDDRAIQIGNERLYRGFFAWNSEVGAASFGLMTFLYDGVCGNHIVWGAKDVKELRIRHVGSADDKAFHELRGEVRRYGDESMAADERRVRAAQAFSLGTNKDEVLDRVFGLKIPGLTRGQAREGYELAERYEDVHGSPRSAWGMASGLTRLSQALPHAEARVSLDRAAGKLLEVAF